MPETGAPDRVVLDLALVLGALGGILGVVLTFIATIRQGGPNRRQQTTRRQSWPVEARHRIAELERQLADITADSVEWRRRWEESDAERLQLLRERRDHG